MANTITTRFQYAGVQIPLVTKETLAFADMWIPFDPCLITSPITPDQASRQLQTARPHFAPRPPLKLGQLFYPTGLTRWTEFHFVATESIVAQLRAQCFSPGSGQAVARQLVLGDNINQQFITSLYMLPPRPLVQNMYGSGSSQTYDPNQLWLVTLVDERYYFQFVDAGKIRPSSQTWTQFVQGLCTTLGIADLTAAGGAIPAAYGTPDDDSPLYSNYENAAQLLEAALWNVGRWAWRTPATGAYGAYPFTFFTTVTDTSHKHDSQRVAGGGVDPSYRLATTDAVVNSLLPASVNIVFPKYLNSTSYIDTRNATFVTKPSYGDAYSINVTLSGAGFGAYTGVSGKTAVLHDTAKAFFALATDPTPINQTQLSNLATQLATDFYNVLAMVRRDEVMPGIYDATQIQFNGRTLGFLDLVYTLQEDKSTTRLYTPPFNFNAIEYCHNAPGTGTLGTGGGGGASLTVKDVNPTTLTLTSVSTEEIDNTNGLFLTNPTGNARIGIHEAFGPNTPGAVTGNLQVWTGNKIFPNATYIGGGLGFGLNYIEFQGPSINVGKPTGVGQIINDSGSITFWSGLNASPNQAAYIQAGYGIPTTFDGQGQHYGSGIVIGASGAVEDVHVHLSTDSIPALHNIFTLTKDAVYGVEGQVGITTVIPPNSAITVRGGIIIGAGTSSVSGGGALPGGSGGGQLPPGTGTTGGTGFSGSGVPITRQTGGVTSTNAMGGGSTLNTTGRALAINDIDAVPFYDPVGGVAKKLVVYFVSTTGISSTGFTLALYSNNNNVLNPAPLALVAETGIQDVTSGPPVGAMFVALTTPFYIQPNTLYWLVVHNGKNSTGTITFATINNAHGEWFGMSNLLNNFYSMGGVTAIHTATCPNPWPVEPLVNYAYFIGVNYADPDPFNYNRRRRHNLPTPPLRRRRRRVK